MILTAELLCWTRCSDQLAELLAFLRQVAGGTPNSPSNARLKRPGAGATGDIA
jgi:hypothetical protein